MRSHIDGRPEVKIPTIYEPPLHRVRQYKHPQSHECQHRALTRPTACSPCCPQTATTHCIESSTPPFFGCHLHLSGHLCIFLINVGLQPSFRNVGCHGQYQLRRSVLTPIGQSVPVWLDRSLFNGLFDELPSAVVAFESLFTSVDTIVLRGCFKSLISYPIGVGAKHSVDNVSVVPAILIRMLRPYRDVKDTFQTPS